MLRRRIDPAIGDLDPAVLEPIHPLHAECSGKEIVGRTKHVEHRRRRCAEISRRQQRPKCVRYRLPSGPALARIEGQVELSQASTKFKANDAAIRAEDERSAHLIDITA